MTRPRMFFLTTSLNVGGTEMFLAQTARRLRDNYEIHIGYIKEKGILGSELESRGFILHHVPGLRHLVSHLRSGHYDLLQTFLYRAHIMGRLGGALARVPSIVTTQQAVDTWKNGWLSLLDRLTAPLSDLIITNSLAAAESLNRREKIARKKMHVIYNGIDGSRFVVQQPRHAIRKDLGIPESAMVVACVLRLHYDKGADLLPEIAARSRDAFFVVAGDGPQRSMIEQKMRELGISHRCMLLGWRQDIPRLLKSADLFLLPSREESFPQALLETMAAGVPAIAANVGGVGELIEDGKTGVLVPPGAVDTFAGAVEHLGHDRELRENMGRAALERSAYFSEDRMIAEMNGIYRELLYSAGDTGNDQKAVSHN